MTTNANLHRAKREKNDEFYTRYEDIEKELVHYIPHFKDKVVYCNCDSEKSNFYKFLKDHFEEYGLKRLICTHYNPNGQSYAIVVDRDDMDPLTLEDIHGAIKIDCTGEPA